MHFSSQKLLIKALITKAFNSSYLSHAIRRHMILVTSIMGSSKMHPGRFLTQPCSLCPGYTCTQDNWVTRNNVLYYDATWKEKFCLSWKNVSVFSSRVTLGWSGLYMILVATYLLWNLGYSAFPSRLACSKTMIRVHCLVKLPVLTLFCLHWVNDRSQ